MSSSVVMISSYDPDYLRIFEHLVRAQVKGGSSTVAFDITALEGTPFDSYHRGALKRFGLEYPGHDLGERMTALGAEYLLAGSLPGHDDGSPLDDRLEELLAIAVQSALITYFRTDRPNLSKRLVRAAHDRLQREGRTVYRAARALCARDSDITVAYLPNGRFPHQKLAMLAFHDAGVPTRHIEKGEGPARAYVQDYTPQDRLRSQDAVASVLAGLSPERVDEIADAWLAKRAPAKDSRNEFSALWNDTLPEAISASRDAGTKVAGFFTSSQDEFQFLGPDWQLHDWTDQFEAFDLIMSRFEAAGYACYLRVHPNLATKANECFVRERAGIRELARRHPKLSVIWHDDQANTYALLDASDAVVVWDSTVGLEASARGLPVWTTATSRYGLVADIRELLSTADVEQHGTEPWSVDPHLAKRFIAYLVMRDEDVVTDGAPWIPWDAANPPLGAKLAAAAVSGGVPTVGAAVGSLVDVYRHRRLSANLRSIRGR